MSKLWITIVAGIIILGAFMVVKRSFADEVGSKCQYTIGDCKLISLFDGQIDFPLKNIIKDGTDFDHPYFHAQDGASIQVPINVFLLDTGANIILFDTGLAGMFHSKTGRLAQSMEQAGYRADQITAVCITHFHPDHISGLVHVDGSKAFANATVYVAQSEVDYWLGADVAGEHASIASLVKKILALYNVHKCNAGDQLFDGVFVYASAGHTPGHIGFLCQSGQQKLLVWGDLMHMPEIQFAHPGISFLDDTDHVQAIATRKHVLAQAVQDSLIIAGVHLVCPGVGTVQMQAASTADQPSYRWVPINPVCAQ